ncbi:MAG TPA: hypothetical protein PKA00_23085 [Saprospiraceae bacterium]|nr:hypothetical protein [Saprospiraceae bacterium]HMQ85813.1 hypothetical protein [Saprospiraceae bacterium]
MQNLFLKLSGFAFLLTLLIATGCDPDDPIVDPLGPDASLVEEAGFLSDDSNIEEGETFSVKLRLFTGDTDLSNLTFKVDGAAVPGANIGDYIKNITSSNSGSITPQNPLLVTGDDKLGATYEIEITPFGQLVDETVTYSFEIKDDGGLSDEVSIDVTVIFTGTPTEMEINGVLFNQSGPAGTGGLDLDAGNGTGSGDASAEIRDMGIDCALPNASNWRKQMGAVNGTEVRQVDLAAVEGFTFDDAKTKEAIQGAYDSGITFSSAATTPCSGSPVTVQYVTDPVSEGDMFVVKKGTTYYLVRVDAVTVTTNNNDDNYEVSIKY